MELFCLCVVPGTPRNSSKMIKEITGRQYIHTGLEVELRSLFGSIQESKSIAINVNIDGMTLYENRTTILANPVLCEHNATY